MFTTQSTQITRSTIRSSISIIVYGTRWCAASQRVRRYLDRLGVPYTYRDLESNLEAGRQVQWWTGGSFSHPTIQIGGQILVEPTLNELIWVLSKASIL